MPECNNEEKIYFDATKISFPTDAIKVSDLIAKFPDDFKWDFREFCLEDDANKAFELLFSAMRDERELAAMAYNQEAEINPNAVTSDTGEGACFTTPEEIADSLNREYIQLGLSHGKNETKEHIRRAESLAKAQAKSGKEIS